MTTTAVPTPQPSPKKLLLSIASAVATALLILLLIVLPAEYGIDYTGAGKMLGLANMAAPRQTITLTDNLGGNQTLREVKIPSAGEPTPLPNPAVFQDEALPPATRTLQLVLPPEKETEIKVKMQSGKVIAFSWKVAGDGDADSDDKVYVDYHGHDPSFGSDFFVRYKEEQQSAGGNGTLTAPFAGEHGWYWLNFNDHAVTVTVTVTGYFDDLIDYGIH